MKKITDFPEVINEYNISEEEISVIIELHKNSVVAEHINNLNILDNFIKDQQGKIIYKAFVLRVVANVVVIISIIRHSMYYQREYQQLQDDIHYVIGW